MIDDEIKSILKEFKLLDSKIVLAVNSALTALAMTNNKVAFNVNNIKIIQKIDSSLTKKELKELIDKISKSLNKIIDSEKNKYSGYGPGVVSEIKDHAAKFLNTVNIEPLYIKIQNRLLAQMSRNSGATLTDLRKSLKNTVISQNLSGKEFASWTQRTFYMYSRATGNAIRQDLGLKYAIYQGGLITTSRDVPCRQYNGKVVTEQEILDLAKIDFPGKTDPYDPLIDLGGYGCRHRLDWISKELAFKLRPELKNKL